MAVTTVTRIKIVCDNPDCPGNDLDPADRAGWIFIGSELYGQPSTQLVFCSSACLSAHSASAIDDPDNVFPPPPEVTPAAMMEETDA